MKKFVGIDVSKGKLDVHIRPESIFFSIPNDEKSINKLITKLRNINPELVVLEPTGGYEREVYYSLSEAGIKIALVNAKRIRSFAIAINIIAKTDKIDASVIARFAELVNPEIRAIPDKKARELSDLLRRRKDLVEIKTAETSRLKVSLGETRKRILEHINWLNKEIKEIEKILFEELPQDMKENVIKLEKVPGVGRILALTLVLELPELGTLSNKEITALAGLAPVPRESGTFKGKRRIFGGRKEMRVALYMPVLTATKHNPIIRDFYQRLLKNGKPPKVALTACMHKLLVILNSIIKSGNNWDVEYQQKKSVK